MSPLETCFALLFVLCSAGAATVCALYPLALRCADLLVPRRPAPQAGAVLDASLIVALRNAEALVEAKVRNCLELCASGQLEILFVSDGSRDATLERLRAAGAGRIEIVANAAHRGKAAALDDGARRARGEILVFSDADALLERDALLHLLAPFADPRVGGVCGQRVIAEDLGGMTVAQSGYVAADSAVKRAESRLGSVTSNDGKLYAIRRELHRPFPPGATDDLFACLSVVAQGRRFVFEPRARALIRAPSRHPAHELARRRRIVARSLNGIALQRGLLDPRRHGLYAVQLLINKVLRRLLPLFLAGLFAASLALAPGQPWARAALVPQLAFLGLAACHGRLAPTSRLGAAAATAWYVCLGNAGTLLGLLDFARGRVTLKWDPIKCN